MFQRWFFVVFAASLASEVTHSLFLHVPGLMLKVGYNEARIGLIAGAAAMVAVVVRPGIGRLINRRGRRLAIRVGTGLLAAVSIGYAFVDQAGVFLVTVRIVQGVADALTYTAFFAYVADRVPAEKRTQGLGLFGISGLAPIGLGTAAGDFILASADYRLLFFVAAGFSLIALTFAMTLPGGRVVGGEAPKGFFHALLNKDLIPVWLAAALVGMSFSLAFVYVKTFVDTSGLVSVGPFFLAYSGVAVLLRLAFGWVPDHFGPKRVYGPGLVFYIAAFLVLAFTRSSAGLLVAGVLAGAGHSLSFPIALSLATLRSGPDDRGSVTTVFMAVIDVAAMVMTPVIGALITAVGYTGGFVATSVVLLLGLATFYRLDRKVSQTEAFTSAQGTP